MVCIYMRHQIVTCMVNIQSREKFNTLLTTILEEIKKKAKW